MPGQVENGDEDPSTVKDVISARKGRGSTLSCTVESSHRSDASRSSLIGSKCQSRPRSSATPITRYTAQALSKATTSSTSFDLPLSVERSILCLKSTLPF